MLRVFAIVVLQALVFTTYANACENGKLGGFYAGVAAGYGTGEFDFEAVTLDNKGAVVGGYTGYNYQCGEFVFGVEGDALWSGMDGNTSGTFLGQSFSVKASTKYLASVRGRLGYDVGHGVMLYGTAGIGFVKADVDAMIAGVMQSATDTDSGLVVGGGIEGMVFGGMSLRAEVLHYRFGTGEGEADFNPTVFRVGGAFHIK